MQLWERDGGVINQHGTGENEELELDMLCAHRGVGGGTRNTASQIQWTTQVLTQIHARTYSQTQLFDQPNFMGNSISFQGPIKILRLADMKSTGGGW